jgi:hypothetical protein
MTARILMANIVTTPSQITEVGRGNGSPVRRLPLIDDVPYRWWNVQARVAVAVSLTLGGMSVRVNWFCQEIQNIPAYDR